MIRGKTLRVSLLRLGSRQECPLLLKAVLKVLAKAKTRGGKTRDRSKTYTNRKRREERVYI